MLNISFFIAAFSSIFWLIYGLSLTRMSVQNIETLHQTVCIILFPIALVWGIFFIVRSYFASKNSENRIIAILEQLKKQTENTETLGCALLAAEKEIKNGFILREFDTLIADANEILAEIIKRSNSISSAQMEHLWSRTAGGERWLIAKTFIETYNFQSDFATHLFQRAQKDSLLKGSILEFHTRIASLYQLISSYDSQRVFYNIIATGALGKTYELITPIAEKLSVETKKEPSKPAETTAIPAKEPQKDYFLTEEQDIAFPSFLSKPVSPRHREQSEAQQIKDERKKTEKDTSESATDTAPNIDASLKIIRNELLAPSSPAKTKQQPIIKSFANTQTALRGLKKEPSFSIPETDASTTKPSAQSSSKRPVISLDELEKEINASPENSYDEYAYPFGAWSDDKKNK